jgi:hypothetical protein
MSRFASVSFFGRAALVLAVVSTGLASCSDVGDNGLSPGSSPGQEDADVDATSGVDGTTSSSGGGFTDSRAPLDGTMSVSDTGSDGVAPVDGQSDDVSSGSDASDSGGVDSSPQDDSGPDAGPDAGEEAGEDAGPDSSGSGGPDAGPDSSEVDSGPDAPSSEAGVEAGVDAAPEAGGGGLVPCTTGGQTGCVPCDGNTTGVCTPTEAAFVAYDIKKGNVTAPGAEPMDACYECLLGAGCLDDNIYLDTGNECGDSLATGTSAQCLATLQCILDNSCAATRVNACYCGTATPSGTCTGNPAPGPINGACAAKIAAGEGFGLTDGTDNLTNLTDNTRASGMADQMFQCALSGKCTACQ